jgi:hypothetical protein
MSGDWDELERRAHESATGGGGAPAEWGAQVVVEVGETFRGRVRHADWVEGGRSGGFLVWDGSGNDRYIWSCTSLRREWGREKPSVGDDLVVSRGPNYRSRFDDTEDAPSGLSYGVATRENRLPLPAEEPDPPNLDELF